MTPFTVSFAGLPTEHDGAQHIVFRVSFNKRPSSSYSYVAMRDETLIITQGTQSLDAAKAKRLNKPHNDRWEITIAPVTKDDLTININATTDCATTGAVCTQDNEVLSNSVSETVLGPPSISVADAQAKEGSNTSLEFEVTLNRTSSSTITVDYATSDGSATAGSDYSSTNGTLTFSAGQSSKSVSVPLLDDTVDDGGETMTLTLSNPAGGNAYLAVTSATGTINNSDPMPKAWLGTFRSHGFR